MFSAVHSDRSGSLVIATDYTAAMSDGSSIGPLGHAVRLPAGTDVVPLPGRIGIGLDRSGRARDLGAGRFGVAAIVPIGYLRIGLPAYEEDPVAPPLKPRGYAAVGADADGELVVAAIALDTEAGGVDGRAALDLGGRTRDDALRALTTHYERFLSTPLTLRHLGKEWRATPRDLGAHVDVETVVNAALAIGRDGAPLTRLRERASSIR